MKNLRALSVFAFAVSALSACTHSASFGDAPIFAGTEEVAATDASDVMRRPRDTFPGDSDQNIEADFGEDIAAGGEGAAPQYSLVPAKPNWHEVGLAGVVDRQEVVPVVPDGATEVPDLPDDSGVAPSLVVADKPEITLAPDDQIHAEPIFHIDNSQQIAKSPPYYPFETPATPALQPALQGSGLGCFPDCS